MLGASIAFSNGDPTQGAELFKKQCASCHALNEAARPLSGPHLVGVVNATAGRVAGFKYSKALQEAAAAGLTLLPLMLNFRFNIDFFISDYFIKPLHATKVKIVEPNIFNIPIAQIGKNLFFQWFVLPILFLSSLIFLFFSILDLRDFVLFNLVLFFLLIFLIPNKILNSLSLAQKIIYPFPSLLIGLNFFMGGISGILLGVIIKIKDLFFYINDYTRILLKVILRNGNPIQIVNFITARCNLRCNHCFYKDTLNAPNPGEMSLDRINNYTKKFGKILWYALGGGEPFIRNDLHKMYEVIYNNCRPKVFTIPTNGWYIEKIFIST